MDSGANDHMPRNSVKYEAYNPSPRNQKTTVADGNLITIVGQGRIQLTTFLP